MLGHGLHLAQQLVRNGCLAEDDLPRCGPRPQAASPAKALHEILIENNFAREEAVMAALGEELGMAVVDLTT